MNRKIIDVKYKKAPPSTNNNNYHKCRARGIKCLKDKKYAAAITEFTNALRLNPGLDPIQIAIVYRNLGYAYEHTGKRKLAMEYYNKAIETNPAYSAAYSDIGRLHKQQRALHEALNDFTLAILYDPKNIHAYHNRHEILSKLGRGKEAEADRKMIEQLKAEKNKPA